MKDFPGRWGIAGGWAIDLFLGRDSRPHADIDVALFRSDQRALRSLVAGARVSKVVSGELAPWLADDALEHPIHEVHVTWPDDFHLEFLLNEHDPRTGEWVFRRDPRIRRPAAAAFGGGPGIPYLAPEIVLLFKSKEPAPKDDADLHAALPRLRGEQRKWLGEALAITVPEHPWLDVLSRSRALH